jgi:hypothetical protein
VNLGRRSDVLYYVEGYEEAVELAQEMSDECLKHFVYEILDANGQLLIRI